MKSSNGHGTLTCLWLHGLAIGRFYPGVIGAGFGMAAYSVLLGVFDLPCITDSCGEVMNSRYGKMFDFPVGLFALPLWLGLLVPSVWIRRGACGLLVAGSVYFVLIQAFVLQSFCVVCAVHAAAAFSLLVFRPAREAGSAPVFVGAFASLALIGMSVFGDDAPGGVRLTAEAHGSGAALASESHSLGECSEAREASGATVPIPGEADEAIELVALFTEAKGPGAVVLSSSCPACVQLIERVLAEDLTGKAVSPAIWRTTDDNRESTEMLVAASMEEGTVVPEKFRQAFTAVVLKDRNLFYQGDAEGIGNILAENGFGPDAEYAEAERLLAAHAEYTERHGLRVTPRILLNGVEQRLQSMDMIIRDVSRPTGNVAADLVTDGAANDGRESR